MRAAECVYRKRVDTCMVAEKKTIFITENTEQADFLKNISVFSVNPVVDRFAGVSPDVGYALHPYRTNQLDYSDPPRL